MTKFATSWNFHFNTEDSNEDLTIIITRHTNKRRRLRKQQKAKRKDRKLNKTMRFLADYDHSKDDKDCETTLREDEDLDLLLGAMFK